MEAVLRDTLEGISGRFISAPTTLLMLAAMSASAQQGATVAGRTVDSTSRAPIPSVTIVLVNSASGDTLAVALTRTDGRFLLRGLTPGRYDLITRFPGYKPVTAPILVSALNPAYDTGDILLAGIATLTTVVVTADSVRTAAVNSEVYRLGDGATTTTGTALDALKSLPGVTVDQEGRVLLRGSDRVAVLIDGRPSSLTGLGSPRGLDNIAAGAIEAVEIIHNPSARFDAAGMAGIINIIYRQERRMGFSGDAGVSVGMGQFTKQRADIERDLGSYSRNAKFLPSVSLTYNARSIRASLQAEGLLQRHLPNNEFTTRYYDDGRVIESQVPENRSQHRTFARAGADFGVGGPDVLSLSVLHDRETHTDRARVPFILQPSGERERFWYWRELETNGLVSAALNWRHSFRTPGHFLVVNLQYSRAWEDESYWLNEVSRVRTGVDTTHVLGIENTVPLAVDYTRPLRSGRIELGGRLQRRWLPVEYTVGRGSQSVIYPGLGDFTDWRENILAAYTNLVHVTEAYTFEAGLRIEQTATTYTVPAENIYYDSGDAYDYLEVFPNVRLDYALGGSFHAVAAYNRRIDRPGEQELRIFPKYDDPELLKVGNPYLRPQLTQVVELGISRRWSNGSTTVSGYRRDIADAFQRIYAIDSSSANHDIVNKLYGNVGHASQTGVQLVAEQQVASPWRVSGSVHWYVHDLDSLEATLRFPTLRRLLISGTRDNTWDLSITNRFRLPGDREIQVNFLTYAGRNVPQGRERARSSLDFSATQPLWQARGDVSITFTDIFNDFGVRREVHGAGFDALYENLLETQVARVRMRLRFQE